MFSVIIVAAGKSTRMVGINKQLLELDGIPVIIRSIMAFDNIANVNEIIVVTNDEMINNIKDIISQYDFIKPIKITIGGKTRQESVINGYKLINNTSKYIVIHDGARPFICEKIILKIFDNAIKYKASVVGVPVKDTIKQVKDGIIINTPDRSSLYITQTPQVFEKTLYDKGLKNAFENNLDFTDDCQLVEAVGANVFMTDGEYTNIKITTPDDIKIAEGILRG